MKRIVLAGLALLAIAGLVALGLWQLERRAWKLALIAQVERRLSAAPVAAPGPRAWPRIGRDDAYRRVTVRGTFMQDRETLVQAATALGRGYWVMTPLRHRVAALQCWSIAASSRPTGKSARRPVPDR